MDGGESSLLWTLGFRQRIELLLRNVFHPPKGSTRLLRSSQCVFLVHVEAEERLHTSVHKVRDFWASDLPHPVLGALPVDALLSDLVGFDPADDATALAIALG